MIPLALGAAVSPVLFFGAIGVMTGPSPLAQGAAYALGAALPLLGLTALALALGRALSLPEASDAVKGAIDIAFGVLLLGLGVRTVLRSPPSAADGPQRQAGSPRRCVATGAGLMVSNVTTIALYLPAMKLVSESSASAEAKAAVVAIALVITLALVLVPLAIVAVAPATSGRVLETTGAWLAAHRRRLAIVICLALGAYLVIHGVARVL